MDDLVGGVLCFGVLFLLSGPDDVLFAHDVGLVGRVGARDVEQDGIAKRVIEDRVGDETARVDDFAGVGIHVDGLAGAALDGAVGHGIALELVGVERLDVASVVLVVIGELIVEEDAGIEPRGHAKVEAARSCRAVPGPGGRLEVGRVLVVELVAVLGRRHLGLVGCGGRCGALGVVEGELVDLLGKVVDDSADGCKDDGDEEESGQYGSGRENGLPCFQALLLECGVGGFALSELAQALGRGSVAVGIVTGAISDAVAGIGGAGIPLEDGHCALWRHVVKENDAKEGVIARSSADSAS